jgi:hypothetical protein
MSAAVNLIILVPHGVECSCGQVLVNKAMEIVGAPYVKIKRDGLFVKCRRCKSLRPIHWRPVGGMLA